MHGLRFFVSVVENHRFVCVNFQQNPSRLFSSTGYILYSFYSSFDFEKCSKCFRDVPTKNCFEDVRVNLFACSRANFWRCTLTPG